MVNKQIVYNCKQGRIYVANELTTFLEHVDCQSKTQHFELIYLEWKINLSVGFWGITYNVFSYLEPFCREPKIQIPTSRVVETLKYAP